jgi:Clp amino terminal domain, pathogenicity island component
VHRGETVLPLGLRNLAIYPFDRFTQPAKKALSNAQEEAEQAGHNYIGTEHLLLGILRETDALGAKVLSQLGIYSDDVRAQVKAVLGRQAPPFNIVQIIPTSAVKRSIELAFQEAERMRSDGVGTEHLLLGLLGEGSSIAPHVLGDMGVDEARVRAEIDRLREGGEVEAGASTLGIERVFELRARVLVHDAEPPYRLWEGRITGHQEDRFKVQIDGHSAGEEFLVEPARMHPIPPFAARRCEFCQAT